MNKKSIHFVGIKGVGMTALAVYCKERGYHVSGCDSSEYFQTESVLKSYSIPLLAGFNEKHVDENIDTLIYSGAYSSLNNADIKQAEKLGIETLNHGQALGMFMTGSKGISIAGTHGKTTITSLVVTILITAGLDPSYIIGTSAVKNLKSSGHYGKGKYFVVEADEYQSETSSNKPRFLWQNPYIAVISNIEYDHPDMFNNIIEVRKTFELFIRNIKPGGILIYNEDDGQIKKIIKNLSCKLISFGKSLSSTYRLLDSKIVKKRNIVTIRNIDRVISFPMNIYGEHNSLNATAAFALADTLGVDKNIIKKSFLKYYGSDRRFEIKKEKDGILYYDDYAHHPTAIHKTLLAFKQLYPDRRLIVIFQPHTYSRTKALLAEFAKSFNFATKIILLDIYSSARENKMDYQVTSRDLKDRIARLGKDVYYAESNEKVLQYLNKYSKKGDIVITMGAGDIFRLHDLL